MACCCLEQLESFNFKHLLVRPVTLRMSRYVILINNGTFICICFRKIEFVNSNCIYITNNQCIKFA